MKWVVLGAQPCCASGNTGLRARQRWGEGPAGAWALWGMCVWEAVWEACSVRGTQGHNGRRAGCAMQAAEWQAEREPHTR